MVFDTLSACHKPQDVESELQFHPRDAQVISANYLLWLRVEFLYSSLPLGSLKPRPQHIHWTELTWTLNKSTQLLHASTGHACHTTYFVLIGSRHSELGRIVHELQFTRRGRFHPLCSEVEFSSVQFIWCERGFRNQKLISASFVYQMSDPDYHLSSAVCPQRLMAMSRVTVCHPIRRLNYLKLLFLNTLSANSMHKC